ncbi:MAG TPA: hypothetical protein VGO62_03520 [Myxococcota bacterium]|jgi:hypothetical protein
MRKFFGSLSALAAITCAMFFAMFLHDFVVGGSATADGVLIGLIIFFGALMGMTGYGAYRGFARAPASAHRVDDAALEARVLALAADNEGAITVAELALKAAVPLDRAEAALDALAVRGRANLETTESGEAVYRVKGFLSAADKKSARDPLAEDPLYSKAHLD